MNDKIMLYVFYSLLLVCCLIFIYKIFTTILLVIRYFKCMRKYKNLIPNCIEKCKIKENEVHNKYWGNKND